ncbi:MAG: metallophosphoesterase [Lacunisphaera sp.]|nr:metallophosphoesterase [Lacunisphaera sp.]
MNRRSFLQQTGRQALGLAVLPLAAQAAAPAATSRQRVLRAAHLTDIHVQPGLGAPAGMAAALRHAQGLADRPDLILFGGDCIGDALENPRESVLEQWAVWDRVLAAELHLPACQCLGNHDIFGWKMRGRPGVEQDALYGKTSALERLGLKSSFYSFDRAGWHFVVLDSMQIDGSNQGYIARLDEAQFAWLEHDLATTPSATPVCVLSHIPILSAASFFDGDLATTGNWIVPGAWMHIDARRIKDLFYRHPNVKVCLSGHLHMEDDVTYLGVRYLCNGAVCGGWWKGKNQQFGPAYAVIDFYADGRVDHQMVTFTPPPV